MHCFGSSIPLEPRPCWLAWVARVHMLVPYLFFLLMRNRVTRLLCRKLGSQTSAGYKRNPARFACITLLLQLIGLLFQHLSLGSSVDSDHNSVQRNSHSRWYLNLQYWLVLRAPLQEPLQGQDWLERLAFLSPHIVYSVTHFPVALWVSSFLCHRIALPQAILPGYPLLILHFQESA